MKNSLTGSIKQALSSESGFAFKSPAEVPSKLAYDGVIYTKHSKTHDTRDAAKEFGSALKADGKARSIRIGNGVNTSGGKRKKTFFVYVLGTGKIEKAEGSIQAPTLEGLTIKPAAKKSASVKKSAPAPAKKAIPAKKPAPAAKKKIVAKKKK